MKSSLYRVFTSATVLSALVLVLGAPKKWG
jgi:hypothetical protein